MGAWHYHMTSVVCVENVGDVNEAVMAGHCSSPWLGMQAGGGGSNNTQASAMIAC